MPCDCVNGPTLDGLPFALGAKVNVLKQDCSLHTMLSSNHLVLKCKYCTFFFFFVSVDSFQFLLSISSPSVHTLLTQC